MIRTRVPRGTILWLSLIVSNNAYGSTWNVDPTGAGDTTNIGDALVLSESGDTIEVAPGTYLEALDFLGKDLTLISTDGSGSTFISAPEGAAIKVENGETISATIDGFTILDSDVGISVYESSVTVLNCVFEGGGVVTEDGPYDSDTQGAAIRAHAATISLENIEFTDNTSAYGTIFATSESHLFGSELKFSGNESLYGADIYAEGAVLDLNTVDSADSVALYGGSIYVVDSTLTINDLTVSGPYATYSGGALYTENSTVEIKNATWNGARNDTGTGSTITISGGSTSITTCEISESMSTGSTYGAVYISEGELQIDECAFEANQNDAGAHIAASNATVSLSNSTMQGGQADNGGAISVDSSELSISATSFLENNGEDLGGAIYATNSTIALSSSEFEANTAKDGGALSLEAGEASLTDTRLTKNRATNDGGAINATDSNGLIFDGVQFVNNEASDKGGAVYAMSTGGITMQDASFKSNVSGDLGGAIWTYDTNAIIALRTLFTENQAVEGAGAVYQNLGTSDWTNTLFQDNEATEGGGGAFILNGATFTMTNSDILANQSTCCGAIYAYNSGVELVNNIFGWNSVGAVYTEDSETSALQSHRYNAWYQNSVYEWGGEFEDRSGQEGNFIADPEVRAFSDDGDSTNDRLTLEDSSPCIDAGQGGQTDWDGSPTDIGLFGGPNAGVFDIDADGVTIQAGDCDDQDATVLPGALEECDDIDNDCDGVVDEDCPEEDTGDDSTQEDTGGADTGNPNGEPGGPPGKLVLQGKCGCSSTGNTPMASIIFTLFVGLLSIRRRSFTLSRSR